jgi:hypothetical protein
MTRLYASGRLKVFLPQSGFVQQAFAQLCAFPSPEAGILSDMAIFLTISGTR